MALNKLHVLSGISTRRALPLLSARWYSDEGAIRDAGGAFSKKEKAIEDQYFRRLEQEQLQKLKDHANEHHKEEIDAHTQSIKELEEQIKRHKEKIERHKKKMEDH
ncbi:PREDICTED: ATPase inhibitor, mitochondrial-like [Amphimedon queenslandica]|uniref:ATPase inhibitor, mitochondrial n=1 Tax=Amphimedon queenslandica TaxID=400682 RepID=A0A1X7UKN2_AMPQE|nr:PREDICTED: ATPase inhibitor, mitochondrial-like [Amphimedon queenslandica]|eukprot:XP_003387512.1 PREDICTED: ATPase inhibitor, mitochondrial-like [Amphimedon queenslandica]